MPSNRLMREQLCDGVHFSSVRDEKFRHNSISIHLIVPLQSQTAAETAILPFLLRKGSRNYPDYTLLEQQLCELYGAGLGSDIMKYGNRHILSFSIGFVDDAYTLGGEVISDRCADLLCDMVLAPKLENGAFDSADFALEQQNLIDTIEAEINDKRTYAVNQCKAMLFENSALATPRYGTVEGARALTPQAAAAQYAQVLDTAEVEITFVGCGNPDAAREKMRALFGALRRHPTPCHQPTLPAAAGTVRQQVRTMEVAQSKLVLGLRAGTLTTENAAAAKLMTTLYGGTPASRLFLNVREKDSLCYYCAARLDRATATMLVDIGVEAANREKAQAAILEQLDVLRNGGFEDRELEETKLAYANGLRSSKDSLGALESWYLVQIIEGGNASPDDEVLTMNAITREAICEAARQVTLDSVYFLTGNGEGTTDE